METQKEKQKQVRVLEKSFSKIERLRALLLLEGSFDKLISQAEVIDIAINIALEKIEKK